MTKPIIALYQDLKDKHKQAIATLMSDYQVKDMSDISEAERADIEILLGWNHDWTAADFEEMTVLKWLQNSSAGMDALPDEVKQSSRILLSNMSGIHGDSIAQNVFAYILSNYRGMYQALADQSEHHWNQTYMDDLKQVNDKVILLFGTGSLSQKIAKIAQVFGMKVIGVNTDGREVEHYDQTVATEDADTVIGEAEIIVNTMPSTSQTRGLFNQSFFEKMNPEAIFINVGRGDAVIEEDIATALNEEVIAGAYLDVFQEEPLPEESPLWEAKHLIITPHTSGVVEHFRDAVFSVFYKNLEQYATDGTLAMNQFNAKKDY